ncbi:MAG: Uma2 family endonuclease [Planctomycetes bacterium]|nr:Uma2 family endonuclease [Planctomycetota bacterium]
MLADRFERLASALDPCELVKSRNFPLSPGGVEHSRVVMNVAGLLWRWAKSRGTGQVLTGEAGVLVGRHPDTVRGVDALYISHKRLPRGDRPFGFLTRRPELIVEVLGQQDTWEKMENRLAEYHKFGVDLVWIAVPQTQTVCSYPRAGKPSLLHEEDELASPKLLPGFRCKVSEIFEE